MHIHTYCLCILESVLMIVTDLKYRPYKLNDKRWGGERVESCGSLYSKTLLQNQGSYFTLPYLAGSLMSIFHKACGSPVNRL